MKQITVQYGSQKLTREVSDDFNVGNIKTDSHFKAGLGFGDNVNVLVDGVIMDSDAEVDDGETAVVETACNTKAQDEKTISIRYGSQTMEKVVPYGWTFGDLRADSQTRAGLGYGDNVNLLVNGVAMTDSATIPNAAVVSVETRCNTKAN